MTRPLLPLLCAGAALAAPFAVQAQEAGAVHGLVALSSAVAPACTLGPPTQGEGPVVNFQGVEGEVLEIAALADPATLATLAARVTVGFEGVCNHPHRLLLRSENNGLWRTAFAGRTPEGFAEAVPYTATLAWGETGASLPADASTRVQRDVSVDIDQPRAGELAIRLDVEPGASNLRQGSPLLAGAYQDTLRITVQPQ